MSAMRYSVLPLLVLSLMLPVSVFAEPVQAVVVVPVQPASINPVEEKVFVVDAALWARPRNGAEVSSMKPLREAVQNLLNNPGSKLSLRYPGGDAGTLWAQELNDWLVSLGIEPDMIVMQPGIAFEDRIELRVIVR